MPNYEKCWNELMRYLENELESAEQDENYGMDDSPAEIFEGLLQEMNRLETES